ncbi:Hypothetical predicted protein [Scomber scombrus]|uniref:Uncharacterized protein n=1 Tax=Scomber scombrus TaxID=13677 RepID=A0AAV1MTY3_SCOSC
MDIRHRDACDPCCFLKSNSSASLSHGHQAPGCLQPLLFIRLTTELRSNGNIGHRDACDPCCFLKSNSSASLSHRHQAPGCLQPLLFICPTTELRSNGNIEHRDAHNPCRFSPYLHHFNLARMFDVNDPAVYSIQPQILA